MNHLSRNAAPTSFTSAGLRIICCSNQSISCNHFDHRLSSLKDFSNTKKSKWSDWGFLNVDVVSFLLCDSSLNIFVLWTKQDIWGRRPGLWPQLSHCLLISKSKRAKKRKKKGNNQFVFFPEHWLKSLTHKDFLRLTSPKIVQHPGLRKYWIF